jgi:hypothetical protein
MQAMQTEYKKMNDPKTKKDYTSSQIAAFMLFYSASKIKSLNGPADEFRAMLFGNNAALQTDRTLFNSLVPNDDAKKAIISSILPDLFGAFGELAYERNRWVIGRCEETSKPGDPLVVNLGAFAHPCSM